MEKCNYKKCENEATTYGHVFTIDKKMELVHACDKHKKVAGFFEATKGE